MSNRHSRKRSPMRYPETEPFIKGFKGQCHQKQKSMETELGQMKCQNEELLKELMIVKNQLLHKEAENERLSTHLDRINMRNLPASEQEKQYEKKAVAWKEKVKELGVIKEHDKNEIRRLNSELENLKKHWNPMKERATKAENNLKNSQEKWNGVRKALIEQLDEKIELVEHWKGQFEQKNQEFDQMKTNNRYMNRMMEEGEEEKRQVQEENVQMKEDVKGFKEECDRVTQISKLNQERIEWMAGRLARAEAGAGRANQQGPTCARPLCVICKLYFGNSGERTPRVMKCGHSLCEECAGQIIGMAVREQEEADAEMAEEEGRSPGPFVLPAELNIACPSCRNAMLVEPKAESIPKNFTVIDSINGTF